MSWSAQAEKGFKAVRELRFPNFGYFKGLDTFSSNKDMDLMSRCTGLKKLVVGIHTDMLDHRTDGSGGVSGLKIKTLKEIMEYYQWEKIFACTSLREIHIHGTYTYNEEGGNARTPVYKLAHWLGDQFMCRNAQDVSIRIEWKEGREDAEV
jgi:hypothetical protein